MYGDVINISLKILKTKIKSRITIYSKIVSHIEQFMDKIFLGVLIEMISHIISS